MKNPFNSPVKILPGTTAIERAKIFARNVTPTTAYGDSNQTIKSKIENDHFISKLGEEAVKKLMEERGNKVVGPDYKIYPSKKKTWVADLIINGIDVAVKTQKRSAASRYGLSWTFQHSEVRKDPILKNPESWVCLVECNDSEEAYECTVFPPRKMKSLLLKEPKLQHLKGKKKVVYANDLFPQKV